MKLLSATIRNYRVHRDTTVDFAGGSMLIAGPNEAGKSTLVEAIHRALFLKGKVSGALLEGMESTTHAGEPQVIVSFLDATGTECRIEKTFGKNKTQLHIDGSPALKDDAADAELARRLGVEDTITGAGGEKKLAQRWAHLWVRQGSSGGDPFVSVSEENQKLFERLQQLGGAALQASELDARLSRVFADESENLWTTKGPAAGSPLSKATIAAEKAAIVATECVGRVAALESAIAAHIEAEATLAAQKAERTGVDAELLTTRAALARLKEIEKDINLLEAQASPLRLDCERLTNGAKLIAKHRATLLAGETAAAANLAKITEAQNEAADQTKAARTHRADLENATQRAAAARKNLEKLAAAAALVRTIRAQAEAHAAVKAIAVQKKEIADLTLRLEALPRVTEKHRKTLAVAADAVTKTRATVEAMGARIRLLTTSGETVTVGGKSLAPGAEISVTEEVELHVGDGVRLQLSPGGAGDLRDARRNFEKAQKDFVAALAPFGVDSVEEAASLLQKINTARETLVSKTAALDGLNPDELDRRLDIAGREHARAQAEAEALGVTEDTPSDDALRDAATAAKVKAEAEEDALARLVKKTATAAEAAAGALAELVQQNATHQATLDSTRGSLGALLEDYGDDETRARILGQKQTDLAACDEKITTAKNTRETLQPEILARRLTRFEKSLEENTRATEAASQRKAEAGALLKSDGRIDPVAVAEVATREAERAARHVLNTRTQAEAVKLLASLFDRHRTAVAQQGAKPLADAAARYLAPVLGHGATLRLDIADQGGAFSGATLSRRDGTTFPFDSLSGGAKEQVGVALRLAMTETLAGAHGGTLPLVLDDAFVNSDAERVRAIRDMLDLATDRGLQVIVLTCHPEQYTGMGWRPHSLTRSAPSSTASATRVPTAPDDETAAAPATPDIGSGDLTARFVAILRRDGLVSSRALREELACSPEEFNATRDALGDRITAQGRSLLLA